jgi:hypothetical protein
VTPHLTVGEAVSGEVLRSAELDVAGRLPIASRATEVVLMNGTDAPGSWTTRARFSLRGAGTVLPLLK